MGFSNDYNWLAYGGDTSKDEGAVIYLYRNRTGVDEWVYNGSKQEVANAIDNGFGSLLSQGAIDYYEVYLYEGSQDYPGLSDSTRKEYKGAFSDWLNNTLSDDYYPSLTGCHFGVTNGFDDAGGQATGTSPSSTAFLQSNWMVLGTGSNNTSRIKSFSIQEPMHTFLSYDVAVEYGYTKSRSTTHEHDTGSIYSDGSVSPMLTTWTNCGKRSDHSGHESCSPDNTCSGAYSQSLTNCTVQAVTFTADKAFGNPVPEP